MKKFLSLMLTLSLCASSLLAFACTSPEKDKVNFKYYGTGTDIVKLFGETETIGLIPEPAATNLTKKIQAKGGNIYRLDLQELYDSKTKAYPQAVLMIKKSVLGANPTLISELESKITQSVSWVKSNTSEAVTAIGAHGVTTLVANALSSEAIDGCKIYWQDAVDSKTSVKNYINSIVDIDSQKASAVSDDFFYTTSQLVSDKKEYSFVMPDGAPAISVAKLLNDEDDLSTGKKINYSVVASDVIKANLVKGTADIILAPVNLASKLYKAHNENDHYVMVSVITHGNFYIMSTEKISINDLCGKQIAVPNMGAVPDWTLQMVLKKHGLSFNVVE